MAQGGDIEMDVLAVVRERECASAAGEVCEGLGSQFEQIGQSCGLCRIAFSGVDPKQLVFRKVGERARG